MNIWSNAVITTAGLNLLAKLVAGNSLAITTAKAGAGFVTPGLLMSQTDVTDIRQELTFSAVAYPSDGKCMLTCRLNNTNLETAYTAMQIGIYATDPDVGEILFFIAQSTENEGTPVPSKTEMGNYNAEWNFTFRYGLADNIDVTVDPAGAVTHAQMVAYVAENASGRRTNRFTVGTSASGWTRGDCDYFCDGTADEVEINNAIAALPSTGGEIILLDGTYKLAESIVIGKNNVTLRGNGNGTKLVRAYQGYGDVDSLIIMSTPFCAVKDLYIDGLKSTYSQTYNNYGISLRAENLLVERCVITNCGSEGIYVDGNYDPTYATIRGNTITNCNSGILLSYSNHGTVTDNVVLSNTFNGISFTRCNYYSVTGNVSRLNGRRNISIYWSNYNVVANNNCSVTSEDAVSPSDASIVIQAESGTIEEVSTHNLVSNNVVGVGTVRNDGGEGSVIATITNIRAGTEDLEAGVSELRSGEIYLVYE